MRSVLKYVPGFRSDVKYKKIIAIIYYLFSLLVFFAGFGYGLFFLAAPFTFFALVDLIRHKKKGIPLKKAIIPFIVSLAIMSAGISAAPEPADVDTSPAPSTGIEQIDESEAKNDSADLAEDQKDPQLSDTTEKPEETQEPSPTPSATPEPSEEPVENENSGQNDQEQTPEPSKSSNKSIGSLKVHYIDVGQGDCALVHVGDSAMLIDAGNRGDGPGIVNYIRSQGINKLDYLILTHPHADHIGGAAEVVKSFDIEKILMPKATHTSQTFENLLVTIQNKGLKITSPSPGDKYTLGNASFQIVACNDGSDLNDKSIVSRLTFGSTSFLFTGDAESATESKILQRGYNIKSDVLKVGHHGSDTSTGGSFLKAVSPKHAIISVGKGNSYGHPSSAVLGRLNDNNVKVYRTDESGTIVVTSDGSSISVNKKATSIKESASSSNPKTTEKSTPKPTQKLDSTPKPTKEPTQEPTKKPTPTPTKEPTKVEKGKFVGSIESDKYHKPSCGSVKNILPENEIWFKSVDEAIKAGYKPCGRCKPPTE